MGRAERRRLEKQKSKAQKVYTLTQAQIDVIKAEATARAVDIAFTMMLAIPVTVLHDKYWVKTAKKRLPEFVDKCLDLYDSYNKGYVTFEELRETLWEEGGVKLERSGKSTEHFGGSGGENSTRAKSSQQEKRIAKALGGKQVIGSGSTPFLKGDVIADKLFVEAKTKMELSKSISVKREWLEKAKAQAISTRKEDYTVAISFGDNKDYYIIEGSLFEDMYKAREALRAIVSALGGLDDPIGVDLDELTASGIRKLIRRYYSG